MKRLPELARRGVALALAASMSLSILAPGALAASASVEHTPPPTAVENSVDELGNVDLSDEVYDVPEDETTIAAPAEDEATDEDTGLPDDLTEEQLAEQALVDESGHKEHIPDTEKLVFEQPSTCTGRGYAIYFCSFELKEEDVTVAHCYHQVIVWLPLADHAWGGWQDAEDADGQGYRECSVCGAVEHEDGIIVTPGGIILAGQDWPDWLPDDMSFGSYGNQATTLGLKPPHDKTKYSVFLKTVKPTCTEQGYDLYKCWCTRNFKTNYKDALGHAWGEWITVEATCTTAGERYRICSRCSAKGVDGDYAAANPPTGHKYGEWIVEDETCTKDAQKYHVCQNIANGKTCGDVVHDTDYEAEHKALGHEWDEGTLEQRYLCEDGKITYKCIRPDCDGIAAEKEKNVAALPHKEADEWELVTAPTCTVNGERIKKCAYGCGMIVQTDTTSDAVKAHGHDLQYKDEWEYPCVEGIRTWYCVNEDCDGNGIPVAEPVAPTKDHTYGDWALTKAPTCEGYGERQRTCTVCGDVDIDTAEGEEVQPIGHDWGEWVDDDKPACQQQTATRRCKREGCTASEQKYLPNFGEDGNPKPHKYTRWDTKVELKKGWIPVEITYAYCDYCNHKEERENNASLSANTQAAKVAADELKGSVRKVVFNALRDVKNNVNAAQTKEEATAAIADLKSSLAKALADKVSMTVNGKEVGLTEEQANKLLSDAIPELDNIKTSLDKSFLSKEAIQAAVTKIVDSVTGSEGEAATEDAAYELLYKLAYDKLAGGTSDYAEPIKVLVGKLANIIAKDDTGWNALTEAVVNDAIALAIEELQKDEEYSKYLKLQLGAEALADVEDMLRKQLVQDPSFMNAVRGYVQNAASNAAKGAALGWSDTKLLGNLRADLMPVSSLVAEKIADLGAGAGDIVDSKVSDIVHKVLPGWLGGDWLSNKLGGFAQGKVTNAVDKASTKAADLIESYLKYITCPKHNRVPRVVQDVSCTAPEITETYCSECGWVFGEEETQEAWGHTPELVPGTDPTETEEGLTDGTKCSVCGRWIEPQQVVPALQPRTDKWLVTSAVTTENIRAAGYENQQKLDAAINAVLTKAGFDAASSTRFFAQVNSTIGILPNDRYPEEGVAGMVKQPEATRNKNCTFYAVQVLTADSHGHNAGDVVVTPLTVTKEGISLTLCTEAVVAIAWKVNE